jgi:exopolyphosphatase / guanosine-5'-triphosphate,3'-diphosphate pyrophosphatase
MITSRFAVIDLGSNTFHLLIVNMLPDGQWTTFSKDRRYVKLASGGLEYIDPDSIQRAIQVMKEFALQIKDAQVDQTRAIGTAALREAKNGFEVARLLEEASEIHIEIIDGQQEADYILKGIQSVLPPLDKPCLIMDIGGGSVEFILFQHQQVLFVQSFKIGVALLFRHYHQHDPIGDENITALSDHLKEVLEPVFNILQTIPDYYLVGASGSFEVIQEVMPKIHSHEHWSELDFKGLDGYMTAVIHDDLSKRKLRKEIPVERIDYIVIAYILIRLLLRSRSPKRLYYCDFALKEGVIAEMA